jgi:DNA-binding CsgD family transcriptional regulator
MNHTFLSNAVTLWEGIVSPDVTSNYQLHPEKYKKLFHFLQIGKFYYYVFDFKQMNCEYISPSIEQVLGIPVHTSMQAFMERIHPDDQPYYLNFENAAIHFLKSLDFQQLDKYKIQYDFRIKNGSGNYIRLLHQAMLVDFDNNKNFIRSLAVHTDINHIKQAGTPCLSFIGLYDEPSYIDVKAPQVFKISPELFTKREKEILKLVIAGHTSEQISGLLFISVHTVNTHRKNILFKSGAGSVVELIQLTIKNNWV